MSVDAQKSLLAGLCGACATSLVVTPLDVLKARLQVQQYSVLRNRHALRGVYAELVRSEGLKGLWRGLGASLFLMVPTTALYMTLYDSLKEKLISRYRQQEEMSIVLAGTVSRCVVVTIGSPLELIRTSIQATKGSPSILNMWKRNVESAGVKGLFRGLSPTLIRDAPFSAIYWVLYERCKSPSSFLFRLTGGKHSWLVFLVSGCLSGMTAAALTTPADVVKTRRQAMLNSQKSFLLQSSPSFNSIGCCSDLNASFWSCGKAIVKYEGYRGLFRGLVPRVAKVAPSCAIMMTCYELCKTYLNGPNFSNDDTSGVHDPSSDSNLDEYIEWSISEY
ncbi:mitochondrial carrier (BOU / S-adenosylmethionine carrier) [Galdieria sulphuraria]|uniref:Mitochondrial carrier (BOU / S-adenosylmethionine carrier) n=1 Tax=Galdieria sulphuraria TaxID=130081 RepID=M2XN68_GALSU|nr:mitochondrial carrier (BOU / S-adenosylmethionine carrier) [Galdieria sulphuraria]EME31642.1 mitochondrial carrier (BOU / S-adenosylmethionine carrier) [Galdieria sulphuraria]|eukprot:XP_005708162.1 mitochondrial carrier (BOU / S-adenosylmethionine carrier) [Galdieria sulphuraria]